LRKIKAMLLFLKVEKFKKVSHYRKNFRSKLKLLPPTAPPVLYSLIGHLVKEHFTRAELRAISNRYMLWGHQIIFCHSEYLDCQLAKLILFAESSDNIGCFITDLDDQLQNRLRVRL